MPDAPHVKNARFVDVQKMHEKFEQSKKTIICNSKQEGDKAPASLSQDNGGLLFTQFCIFGIQVYGASCNLGEKCFKEIEILCTMIEKERKKITICNERVHLKGTSWLLHIQG